ncbi:MAG TPA: hypothetical protein VG477_19180 [Thermoanaerobaculia bacterium]|jgi:hypothetical protein|nr:hypothetical protein [Thermoanaerobaculia bacterium]
MELHTEVLIHNDTLGVKGGRGVLVQISPDGYYEVNCVFGDRVHRTLLPIHGTVLISREPEDSTRPEMEIER